MEADGNQKTRDRPDAEVAKREPPRHKKRDAALGRRLSETRDTSPGAPDGEEPEEEEEEENEESIVCACSEAGIERGRRSIQLDAPRTERCRRRQMDESACAPSAHLTYTV